MDLLIDVNIAVDVCAERQPHAEASAAALDACQQSGGRLWVYTGSLQTLQFNLAKELTTNEADSRPPPSFSKRLKAAAAALADFTADKHWLAALARPSAPVTVCATAVAAAAQTSTLGAIVGTNTMTARH